MPNVRSGLRRVENLEHLILECPEFSEETKTVMLQQPYEEDRRRIIENFLFEDERIEEKKDILHKIWRKRERKIGEQNQSAH